MRQSAIHKLSGDTAGSREELYCHSRKNPVVPNHDDRVPAWAQRALFKALPVRLRDLASAQFSLQEK
ncbi:MAG: hypothetical protein HPZ91_20230 [Lentisphaeria bacterium]|nr:hypothetical protein [Lentisphaeria bacterium]